MVVMAMAWYSDAAAFRSSGARCVGELDLFIGHGHIIVACATPAFLIGSGRGPSSPVSVGYPGHRLSPSCICTTLYLEIGVWRTRCSTYLRSTRVGSCKRSMPKKSTCSRSRSTRSTRTKYRQFNACPPGYSGALPSHLSNGGFARSPRLERASA